MEGFMSTLPPYVHDYLNRYPPTEMFQVLKELISFAVLYANDRERINLLSTQLLENGADQAILHKPYTSPSSTLPSSVTSSPRNLKPLTSGIHCKPILEEELAMTPDLVPTSPIQEAASVSSMASSQHTGLGPVASHVPASPAISSSRQSPSAQQRSPASASNMPYTFPEWWAHPDPADHHLAHGTTSSQEDQVTPKVTSPSTATSLWVPLDNQEAMITSPPARSRPVSMYSPTIPDLRTYLDVKPSTSSNTRKSLVEKAKQEQANIKTSRRMSAPPVNNNTTNLSSRAKAAAAVPSPVLSPTSPKPPPSPLSRSSSSMSNRSAITRPGQTATVRARAEQARQRQLQLDEEKRKQQQQQQVSSRTSLRLKQQVNSGVDWATIKQERRRTLTGPPTE
ncbi:hypothetical protein DM01DRAFT_1332300 [Hesseltinella vesiculosa]|uniref:Uncharacterized protein n=1 Tax=Hesseltinella vesiculosa TaxID=101127 RepID=A0A1X2GUK7_9FUNG|nr:hypothetical protein DM01DRAFT_1332300 [Hesseltinella vesiculosa]